MLTDRAQRALREAIESAISDAFRNGMSAGHDLTTSAQHGRLLKDNAALVEELMQLVAVSCAVASGDTERLSWLDKQRTHNCSSWGYHDGCYRWLVTGQDVNGGNGKPTPIQATVREAIDLARSGSPERGDAT